MEKTWLQPYPSLSTKARWRAKTCSPYSARTRPSPPAPLAPVLCRVWWRRRPRGATPTFPARWYSHPPRHQWSPYSSVGSRKEVPLPLPGCQKRPSGEPGPSPPTGSSEEAVYISPLHPPVWWCQKKPAFKTEDLDKIQSPAT